MAKSSNRVICKNEVLVEGQSIGEFETFTLQARRETLGATATMTLPLYGIGVRPFRNGERQQAIASAGNAAGRVRARAFLAEIKICARVEVFCWYEGYDKVKVFDGFIEHIEDGFPTKFYLRDATFILRFGTIDKAFNENATLQQIAESCIKIANAAFDKERESLGLVQGLRLVYNIQDTKTVQAVTTALSFENFASGRSPFEVIQYLQQQLVMYANAYYAGEDKYNFYIGAGVTDSSTPIIELDTRYNVIGRELVRQDSRFVDYDVKVTGILASGKRFTATAGLKTSKTASQTTEFEKKFGQPVRTFAPNLTTAESIQKFADDLLNSLKGQKNKGTITLLLYPKCEVLDTVKYNDSIFDINDAQYYVIGYSFTASEKGYLQKLEVTDKVFMI